MGLEYDGSAFFGWQRQKDNVSVQTTVEAALSHVANEPIHTVCAGRTDAGVHAALQVVHFDTACAREARAWVYGSNTQLPPAVRVLWAKPVLNTFNARRSALCRRYRYLVDNQPIRPALFREYVTWEYRKLVVEHMQEAANYWVGEHDFSSFRGAGCQSVSPVRHIKDIQIFQCRDYICVEFLANAFLHHMVRNMMGVLLAIGKGQKPVAWAKAVLAAKDRRAGGVTAPAMGLYLVEVQYPEMFGIPRIPLGPRFLNLSKDFV